MPYTSRLEADLAALEDLFEGKRPTGSQKHLPQAPELVATSYGPNLGSYGKMRDSRYLPTGQDSDAAPGEQGKARQVGAASSPEQAGSRSGKVSAHAPSSALPPSAKGAVQPSAPPQPGRNPDIPPEAYSEPDARDLLNAQAAEYVGAQANTLLVGVGGVLAALVGWTIGNALSAPLPYTLNLGFSVLLGTLGSAGLTLSALYLARASLWPWVPHQQHGTTPGLFLDKGIYWLLFTLGGTCLLFLYGYGWRVFWENTHSLTKPQPMEWGVVLAACATLVVMTWLFLMVGRTVWLDGTLQQHRPDWHGEMNRLRYIWHRTKDWRLRGFFWALCLGGLFSLLFVGLDHVKHG
ncbi:hypothetical protein E3E12_07645 [Formicincola oecophyllae]|uniref:Uncharacterized protein n=1 Tax=Formicincola oecophyllae TaxID=2558361 RepID=A0A4Y6UAU9_9PROT|nr:hypothetical protein [Formicincola oecophyllae]QDH14070.1 hypothetical protein E3E12_07645 [Formicincola oecophyllae]